MAAGTPFTLAEIEEMKLYFDKGYTPKRASELSPYTSRNLSRWFKKFRAGDYLPKPRKPRGENKYDWVPKRPQVRPNCIPSVLHKITAGRA